MGLKLPAAFIRTRVIFSVVVIASALLTDDAQPVWASYYGREPHRGPHMHGPRGRSYGMHHHTHRNSSGSNHHNRGGGGGGGASASGGWLPATATWYGRANGAGSDGGACGYGSVAQTAYGSNVGAGSPVLFRNGRGCGACYQVKCLAGGICSETPVTIVIIDECPGGYCAFGRTHFDLSGSAFGHMASGAGTVPALLGSGVVQVLYRRVSCNYRATRLAFEVNEGATNYWFSMLVRYEDGDGDLSTIELMQGGSSEWQQMQQLWGAYWCLNAGPLHAPFSIRLTSSSGMSLTVPNAIPTNWAPGAIYNANVNFH